MKKVIILAVVLILSGCVSATYNPATKEVSYMRVGDQSLGGVEVVLGDGSYITFESQKSEARLLSDALRMLEKGIEIGRND